jgi:tetratricopeptide (TPR) repeat protein
MTRGFTRIPWLLVLALAAIVVGAPLALSTARQRLDAQTLHAARFVGRDACARCHKDQLDQWKGSDHDLAMQVPDDRSVKGDFNNATFEYHGIVSRFHKKDGAYFVQTDGPDGKLTDYPVKYVFGHHPLQQYLIEFPGGRLQCLSIAWDTLAGKWYHLYPNEKIDHRDELHWTKRPQNWNYMCADCHSTNLRKNYDPASDTYQTTWSEINVSCEACHGPGSRHVQWAESNAALQWLWNSRGLTARLKQPDPAPQINACAPCHSRRQLVGSDFVHGRDYHDHFQLETLRDGLYFPDGQFLDEVYEIGSFTQSKMYHMKVRCSDCHNPHSLKLHAPGNFLCIKCHQPDKFDTPAHHHHAPGSPGASCVECHMPKRTYMGVDVRRDHSLRLPRPDLTVQFGAPNACNQCHADKPAQWAADAVVRWYGPKRPASYGSDAHYAQVLAAGRARRPGADADLARYAADPQKPAIVRATVLQLLLDYASPAALGAFKLALADAHPLVRIAAIGGYESLPPDRRPADLAPLLADPVRSVRCQAARLLAPLPLAQRQALGPPFDKALSEYIAMQTASSDLPGGRMNLANLYIQLGQPDRAEAEYRAAIRMDPDFAPARIDLATLLNQQRRNAEAEQLLRQLVRDRPQVGEGWYHLGLLTAELYPDNPARAADTLAFLARAAELLPDHPRVLYNAAIAHQRAARPAEAERLYLKALALEPDSHDFLHALANLHLQQNQPHRALPLAQRLHRLFPDHQDTRQLLQQLQSAPQAP